MAKICYIIYISTIDYTVLDLKWLHACFMDRISSRQGFQFLSTLIDEQDPMS